MGVGEEKKKARNFGRSGGGVRGRGSGGGGSCGGGSGGGNQKNINHLIGLEHVFFACIAKTTVSGECG